MRISSWYFDRNVGSATRKTRAMAPPSLAPTRTAEEALRSEEQHEDEDRENHQELERARQEGRPQRLRQAHDEAAREGAHEVAHAAQDDHHEGHDVERLRHVGRHVEE